jgi:hypothetical protein
MVTRYSLTHPAVEGTIEFEYSNGLLTEYVLKGSMQTKALKGLLERFPTKEELIKTAATNPEAKLVHLKADLSFETFWNSYNNKSAGSAKKVAEKRWDKMSDINKHAALKFIAVYDRELAKSGTAKKYAETYLNQKPWEI